MHQRIELGSYSSDASLQLPRWVPGYCVRVDAAGDEVTISANAQAVRSLAQHLPPLL